MRREFEMKRVLTGPAVALAGAFASAGPASAQDRDHSPPGPRGGP
jgi:hypothetical protein